MPKHLKIMSNDRVIIDGYLTNCSQCPMFSDWEPTSEKCLLGLSTDNMGVGIPSGCPLKDKVD